MHAKMWILIILIVAGVWYLKYAKHFPFKMDLAAKENYWGVTYSDKFATSLGLDWKQAYLAMLDDLNVKYVRIPIYWDEIVDQEGNYDFSKYDYIFDEGAQRNVKFIANVGWRLPRWPECHEPSWFKAKATSDIKQEALAMLAITVEHFRSREEIVYWQVENEPLLDYFGVCPPGDEKFLEKEIALVKNLDSRPIMISASGELSTWRREVKMADVFSTTMYRVVWNPWFGYFRYPMPGWYYRLKAYLAGTSSEKAVISELQAEPWVPNGTLAELPNIQAGKSFDLQQFEANLQTAINADFSQAYLWGVEWWYWKKINGDDSYWQYAKHLFTNNNK